MLPKNATCYSCSKREEISCFSSKRKTYRKQHINWENRWSYHHCCNEKQGYQNKTIFKIV